MIKLVDAIRLDKKTRLAIVGGGGKTTAMFQLARQFETPVIVTTTTHLGTEQAALADVHFEMGNDAPLPDLDLAVRKNQVILVSGKAHADGRLGSIPANILTQVKAFVDERDLPLLIEADGSRKLPVKAPAEKEPVIPGWVNAVVVVVGLSCLGRPASEDTIHRFKNFSMISDIQPGEAISLEHIEKMLVHPMGGLKAIPEGARRIALLNQADDEAMTVDATRLADRLIGVYDTALVSSLKPDGGCESYAAGVKHCAERIAGIVLAAGGASRYGQPKSLLVWQEETLIRRVVRTALATGLTPVVVVVGPIVKAVREELKDLPVQFVVNPDWEQGQSSSLRAAINAVSGYQCGGAIILQADQPRVPKAILKREIKLHAENILAIVVPRIDGHPSSPVLFDRRYFGDLLLIKGDQGGRALFTKFPVQWLDWDESTDLMDIDTQEDYLKLLEMDILGE